MLLSSPSFASPGNRRQAHRFQENTAKSAFWRRGSRHGKTQAVMKVSWEALDNSTNSEPEAFTVPDAPPPPAPYMLTGFEDQPDDYLTSDSLQRVTLQKPPAVAPVEKE